MAGHRQLSEHTQQTEHRRRWTCASADAAGVASFIVIFIIFALLLSFLITTPACTLTHTAAAGPLFLSFLAAFPISDSFGEIEYFLLLVGWAHFKKTDPRLKTAETFFVFFSFKKSKHLSHLATISARLFAFVHWHCYACVCCVSWHNDAFLCALQTSGPATLWTRRNKANFAASDRFIFWTHAHCFSLLLPLLTCPNWI